MLALGPELEFLNEVSAVPLQQALRHQEKAFRAFLEKRARYPQFKSWHGRQSASYTRAAFRMRAGELWLAKADAPLRYVWTWPDIDPATLDPASVTVVRDPAGRWFVTFHVDIPGPEQLPATGESVGVDVGLTHFAAHGATPRATLGFRLLWGRRRRGPRRRSRSWTLPA